MRLTRRTRGRAADRVRPQPSDPGAAFQTLLEVSEPSVLARASARSSVASSRHSVRDAHRGPQRRSPTWSRGRVERTCDELERGVLGELARYLARHQPKHADPRVGDARRSRIGDRDRDRDRVEQVVREVLPSEETEAEGALQAGDLLRRPIAFGANNEIRVRGGSEAQTAARAASAGHDKPIRKCPRHRDAISGAGGRALWAREHAGAVLVRPLVGDDVFWVAARRPRRGRLRSRQS